MTVAGKAFSVHPLTKDGIALSARHEGSAVFLKLAGNVETAGALGVYLRKLHGEALRVGAAQVIVDCDELYFLSVASVKCFVTWIDAITRLQDADRYKIRFRTNANFSWQQRTFDSLRRYGPGLIHVDAESVPGMNASSGTIAQSAWAPTSTRLPHSATIPQSGTLSEAPAARRKR
jgi:hypothetical protein